MKIWSIACLMACLVLPVRAETQEDEAWDKALKRLCDGVPRDVPDPGIWWSWQYVHCMDPWTVLRADWEEKVARGTSAHGAPFGRLDLGCERSTTLPEENNLHLTFEFGKDEGHENRSPEYVRQKEDRVHLQLGFRGRVEASESGGSTLSRTTLDYDWPHRSWLPKPYRRRDTGEMHQPKEERDEANFYHQEAADLVRRMYHSESVDWTDRRTGETNRALIGNLGRKAIKTVMDFCGFNLNTGSSSSSSSQSLQSLQGTPPLPAGAESQEDEAWDEALKRLCNSIPKDAPYYEWEVYLCMNPWIVDRGGIDLEDSRSTLAEGAPSGNLSLSCNRWKARPKDLSLRLIFGFGDYPIDYRPLRRKKDRVHLQLGFREEVRHSESGEGFTLRQTTLDFDWPHRSWASKYTSREDSNAALFYDQEAADLMRRMYHSESVSWTDRRSGETNQALIGEPGREAIKTVMDFCGFSLAIDSSSASSSARQFPKGEQRHSEVPTSP